MEKPQEQYEGVNYRIYIPITTDEQMIARHGLVKLFVAFADEPERVCGFAHRVGYTGKMATDLVIYRLKIRTENSRTVTLPSFYIVEGGIFVEYEEWRRNRNNLI